MRAIRKYNLKSLFLEFMRRAREYNWHPFFQDLGYFTIDLSGLSFLP